MKKEIVIHNLQEFRALENHQISSMVLVDIDFSQTTIDWTKYEVRNAQFFGCKLHKEEIAYLVGAHAFVHPNFPNLPYKPYRSHLYTWRELLDGYEGPENDGSIDKKIYEHFEENKYHPPIQEALAQRVHDHSIDFALRQLLGYDQNGMTQKKGIGFMGGHSMRRKSVDYAKAALTAKLATEKGYFVVSGGGPGIMEAANFGAYMGGKTMHEFYTALDMLTDLVFENEEDKDYLAKNYIAQSQKVLEKFPNGKENLAIPTWFYGHEPTNLFASHIAKYFSNSIREDTLLAISLYGVVFAPGSAGTTQEIFQEFAQNYYGTFDYYSPMIFLGKKRYVEDTAIYPLVHQLCSEKKMKEQLFLTDSPELVIDFIKDHPPIKKK